MPIPAEISIAGEHRRAPRIALGAFDAKLRTSKGSKDSIVLHDLSTHGFRTEWHYPLQKGDKVWLTLPGVEPRGAEVMWSRDYVVGCTFDAPLHSGVIEALLARFG